MNAQRLALVNAGCLLIAGCATVDVTKTAKGYFSPTDPDHVEILVVVPGRAFAELATISTAN